MYYHGPDKRRSKRINRPFVLRLQRTSGSASNEWSFIFIKDISRSGLCFHSDENFQEGELFNLKINVGRNTPSISCVGEVVRVQPLDVGTLSDIAVIFVDISPEDAELIEKAVNDHESGQEG